jgi:undecaprenyl diphosphate synthase
MAKINSGNRTPDEAGYGGLAGRVDMSRLPRHVAIIMDGNGRWAAGRGLPRVAGHRAGATAVREAVEAAARLGIKYLTLYAFSTENWNRPRVEVDALMRLLREFLNKELDALQRNKIRFQMIGRGEKIDGPLLEQVREAERATSSNTGLLLTIAINYGGRAEIVDACRRLAADVSAGSLEPAQIDEQTISRSLYTRLLPDPDLLIRTSGELRLSNFLLWQIAYTEIHITETLWPDFRGRDLVEAIAEYQRRDRRYGAIEAAGRLAAR